MRLDRMALAATVALLFVGSAPAGSGATAPVPLRVTPVTMRVDNVPVPVMGSDARIHVIYELELTNFSSERVTLDRLEVLDAARGTTLATLDVAEVANRLVVHDKAAVPGDSARRRPAASTSMSCSSVASFRRPSSIGWPAASARCHSTRLPGGCGSPGPLTSCWTRRCAASGLSPATAVAIRRVTSAPPCR
jgi:hypothetical protein